MSPCSLQALPKAKIPRKNVLKVRKSAGSTATPQMSPSLHAFSNLERKRSEQLFRLQSASLSIRMACNIVAEVLFTYH